MEQQSITDQEQDFCMWLRHVRVKQDLTQEALAEAVGCATQTIRSFENGRRRPSREMAARLVDVLNIPAEQRSAFIRLARAPLAATEGEDQSLSDSQPVLPAPQRNLHLPPDALIGRHADLLRLRQALLTDRRRLVTLLGAGGIGKTRLALQAAADMAVHFADGAAVVELAPIANPADIITGIAEAIGCSLPGAQQPEQALLAFLRERTLLLVLDNLEHLLSPDHNDYISGFLTRLLREAPQVTLLCTSRERLRLRSEAVVELDGLGLPADEQPGTVERADATLLFLERARQVVDTFAITSENRAAVTHICRLLGGAPLGIELAAAWVRVMSCAEIAAEMARNIDFLALDDRDLPLRHRSMRAVIDHSWQLLTPEEQRVLLHLSVFRGGFRREAAEAICVDALRMPSLLPILSALVDKSLLRRSTGYDRITRYDLHEVVRQYLATRLALDPAVEATIHQQHAMHYATWLAEQDQILKSERQNEALRAITEDIGNIRAMWRWAVQQPDIAMLRKTTETLHWFYEVRGWNIEGIAVFAAGAAALRELAQGSAATDAAQAAYYLLVTLEGWHAVRSDPAAALPLLNAGLAGQRQTRDRWALALCLVTVAYVQIFVGDYPSAQASLEESAAISEHNGYTWVLSVARVVRGVLETLRSDPQVARQHLHRAILTARAVGDPRHVALTLNYLGLVALSLGQADEAERVCRECLVIAQQHQDRFQMSLALQSLGRVAVARSAHTEGKALLDEGLAIARAMGDRWLEAQALGCLAQLAIATDDISGARALQRAAVQAAAAAPQPIALDELAALAELELAAQPDAALAVLAYVRQHPLSPPSAHIRVKQHWHEFLRDLPAERYQVAEATAHSFNQDQPAALLSLFL